VALKLARIRPNTTAPHELPAALIEAGIAAGLTQRELAKRIKVAEQQIQRWEANHRRRRCPLSAGNR
jgi:transcriptional regulator with XRE-family HTH domain